MPLLEFEGKRPRVDQSAFVAVTATLVGDVVVERQASIWYGCVLRGDFSAVVVHARSNVQDGTVLHGTPGYPAEIGEATTVGHNCVIHGAIVGREALIGNGAIVLDDARIGAHSLVAAGSVVTPGARFPENVFIAGVPAEIKAIINGTPQEVWMAMNTMAYVGLAERHRKAARLLNPSDETSRGRKRAVQRTAERGSKPAGPTPQAKSFLYLSDDWLSEIESRTNSSEAFPDAARGLRASIEVEILGGPEGDACWWFLIDDGKIQVGRGKLASANLKYSHDWDTAVAINSRQLTNEDAFFQGRLRISGDYKKLTGLQHVLRAMDEACADIAVDFPTAVSFSRSTAGSDRDSDSVNDTNRKAQT